MTAIWQEALADASNPPGMLPAISMNSAGAVGLEGHESVRDLRAKPGQQCAI